MENLFLQAMETNKVDSINKIKKNKKFLNRVISDLDDVFSIRAEFIDNENNSQARIYKTHNFKNWTFSFSANDKCVSFNATILGYREKLLFLLDKYPNSKADNNFINGKSGHGFLTLKIEFKEDDSNLMQAINDIVFVFEHERISKKF
jgi:hypothetical protein